MIETFTRAKTAAWARENAAGWDLREPSVVVSTVNRETWKRNVSSRSTEASKVKKREREIIIIKKDKRNSRFRIQDSKFADPRERKVTLERFRIESKEGTSYRTGLFVPFVRSNLIPGLLDEEGRNNWQDILVGDRDDVRQRLWGRLKKRTERRREREKERRRESGSRGIRE